MIIRYKWSALGRLYNSPDELRYYYLVLRRLIMSYKKVRSSISWQYDTYFLGRKQIARMKIRGKALMLYLPLEYSEMVNTKYRGKDVSKFKSYKQVPFCYRINGNRKLKYAMELIRQILADVKCVEPEYVPLAQIGEAIPYQTFEELFPVRLIKIGSIVPATGKVLADDDDEDDDDDGIDEIEEADESAADNEEIASHIATGHIEREEFNFTVPEDKKPAVVYEKVSASEVNKLMTDEEAKAALLDLTKPAEETPAEPVVEEPAVTETPAEEPAPVEVVEETAEEVVTETVEETPVEEPAAIETPVETAEETPAEPETTEEAVEEPVVEETPAEEETETVEETEEEAPVVVEKTSSRKPAPKKKSKKAGKVAIVNIDTLDRAFNAGDLINLAILKEKGMVPKNTPHVKILARGTITKPLTVCAGQYSLDAVKMIVLVGGTAVKTFED